MTEAPGKQILWYGQLTTRRRLYRRGLGTIAVAILWLTVFLMIPSLVLVAVTFARRGTYGDIVWTFTTVNYTRLVGYGLFGWSSDNLIILWRSIWMALVTTALSLLLAYPLAFYVASRKPSRRYLLLALIMIPFCTNMVIRTFAWRMLMSEGMPLQQLAAALGRTAPLYPSSFAVYIGMISCFLPFAVLPLYAVVERMDWSIIEAAQDLYASKWRVFRHGVLPQTMPGLSAAIILTFIPAMGTFIVPNMLGGASDMLIGNQIEQQFHASRDIPFGAALSIALVLLTLVGVFLLRRHAKGVPVA